ncbi:MAG: matrixin family metalloprotease [Myxococcota bacterium]
MFRPWAEAALFVPWLWACSPSDEAGDGQGASGDTGSPTTANTDDAEATGGGPSGETDGLDEGTTTSTSNDDAAEDDSGGPIECDGDPDLTAMAQEALAVWQIGLATDQVSAERDLRSYPASPRNWITVADSDCEALGVGNPSSCTGFDGSVLGTCDVTFRPSDAAIVHTTAVISTRVFDGTRSHEQERAVFIHEIGHCLGLAHTATVGEIMYPVENEGVVMPAELELAAVADAYLPKPNPVGPENTTAYFQEINGMAIRHYVPPEFTVSACIGNEPVAYRPSLEPPLVAPDGEPLTTVRHVLRADGGCELNEGMNQ